jgi:transcriptional regulator NrdR family protein
MGDLHKAVLAMQFHRTKKLANDAVRVGNSVLVKCTCRTDAYEKLKDYHVIHALKKMIQRVYAMTDTKNKLQHGQEEIKNINVRVFATSYLFVWRKREGLKTTRSDETYLMENATAMLKIFDTICESITLSESWVDLKNAVKGVDLFNSTLHAYYNAYRVWSDGNRKRQTDRMNLALTALQEADDSLVCDDEDFEKIRHELRAEKIRFLDKIRYIGGEASVKAIEDLRLVMGKSAFTTEMDITAPDGSSGASPMEKDQHRWSAFPPLMSNEQLSHELQLDPGFKLDVDGYSKFENKTRSRIRKIFNNAYWNSVTDDLRLKPVLYVRVTNILHEIHMGVNTITKEGLASNGSISDVLDFDLIDQMIENNMLTWKACIKLVSDILSVMEGFECTNGVCQSEASNGDVSMFNCKGYSRKRKSCEEEKESIWASRVGVKIKMEEAALDKNLQPVALADALRFICDSITFFKIQESNKRLRKLAPILMSHGVEYEDSAMIKKLLDKTLTLEHITKLLHTTISDDILQGRMDIYRLTTDALKEESYTSIMHSAAVALVMNTKMTKIPNYPETFLLDRIHIMELQQEFTTLIRIAVVILITDMHMKEHKVANSTAIIMEMSKSLLAGPTSHNDIASMVVVVNEELKKSTNLDEVVMKRISQHILKCSHEDNDIWDISKKRFRSVILHGMCGDFESFNDVASVVALFTKMKVSPTLYNVSLEVCKLGSRMRSMMALHKKVHSHRYNEIIASQTTSVALILSK